MAPLSELAPDHGKRNIQCKKKKNNYIIPGQGEFGK